MNDECPHLNVFVTATTRARDAAEHRGEESSPERVIQIGRCRICDESVKRTQHGGEWSRWTRDSERTGA